MNFAKKKIVVELEYEACTFEGKSEDGKFFIWKNEDDEVTQILFLNFPWYSDKVDKFFSKNLFYIKVYELNKIDHSSRYGRSERRHSRFYWRWTSTIIFWPFLTFLQRAMNITSDATKEKWVSDFIIIFSIHMTENATHKKIEFLNSHANNTMKNWSCINMHLYFAAEPQRWVLCGEAALTKASAKLREQHRIKTTQLKFLAGFRYRNSPTLWSRNCWSGRIRPQSQSSSQGHLDQRKIRHGWVLQRCRWAQIIGTL